MSKALDLVGEKFNRLTVVSRAKNTKSGKSTFNCVCDCGNTTNVIGSAIKSGKTKSCGCLIVDITDELKQKTSKERLTRVSWRGMKSRCTNENDTRYPSYGAVGIGYDKRWESFCNFISDMGYREEGYSLDRIDNLKGYSKENCRWADNTTQAYNQSCRSLTGVSGVKESANGLAWIASISKDGEYHYLGTFNSFNEAVDVRIGAEKRLYGHSKTESMG